MLSTLKNVLNFSKSKGKCRPETGHIHKGRDKLSPGSHPFNINNDTVKGIYIIFWSQSKDGRRLTLLVILKQKLS